MFDSRPTTLYIQTRRFLEITRAKAEGVVNSTTIAKNGFLQETKLVGEKETTGYKALGGQHRQLGKEQALATPMRMSENKPIWAGIETSSAFFHSKNFAYGSLRNPGFGSRWPFLIERLRRLQYLTVLEENNPRIPASDAYGEAWECRLS